MTKPKLNIREMIRSGEIDTAKAGQLVTIESYTGDGLLSESDIRALRDTAKDAKLYNAYMHGGKELRDTELLLTAISAEAKLGIQKLAWIGAELKYTIETYYTPPRVVAMTEEAYKRLGKDKRERRLKRTYTLVTLYRIIAENFIYNEDKLSETEQKAVKKAKEYPEEAQEGYLYGLDLIDSRKGEPIEYWRGWIPYYNGISQEYDEELPNLDTIDKLEEEIPEIHSLIVGAVRYLYKEKKLDIPDPNTTPLNQWHKTPIKGSELAKIEENLPYLQDILNRPEYSLLDDYKDEGESIEQAHNRSIFEHYKQAYSILKNPEKHRLKDGMLDIMDSLDRPLAWGLLPEREGKVGAKMPLETIKNNRQAINNNLHILYAFSQWRLKAGRLLGVDKTDRFKDTTDSLDAIELYNAYEVHRKLLTEHILSETYILPEFQSYTDEILKAYQPLGDGQEALTKELLHKTGAMDEVNATVASVFKGNPSVAKALELLDDMTIYNIEASFYTFRDAIKPLFSNRGTGNDS